MIRVFITDDHEIYLEGLSLLLGKQEGIEVVGTAASGKELLDRVRDLQARSGEHPLVDVERARARRPPHRTAGHQ